MRGGGNTLFSEERYPASLMAPSTARSASRRRLDSAHSSLSRATRSHEQLIKVSLCAMQEDCILLFIVVFQAQ